jgi:hypothetical protein
VIWNEFNQYVGERGLTTTGSTADQNVLALSEVPCELFGKFSGDGSYGGITAASFAELVFIV